MHPRQPAPGTVHALEGVGASPGNPPRRARWFSVGVALAMIALNIAAFAPALLDPSGRNAPLPLPTLVVVHALASTAWLALFLTQAVLVEASRVALHRRLGLLGAGLALAVVVLGILVVVAQTRRGFDLSGDIGRLPLPAGVEVVSANAALLFFPLQFGALVGAALWFRHRRSLHRRLMLFALLAGLAPTPVAHLIGHWIGPAPWADLLFPVSTLGFGVVVAAHDRLAEGRVHPTTWWLGLTVVALERLLTLVVQRSAAWHAIATRLAG